MTAVGETNSKALMWKRVCSVLETQAWPHIVGKHTLSPGKGMLHAFHYPISFSQLDSPLFGFVGPKVQGGKQAGP